MSFFLWSITFFHLLWSHDLYGMNVERRTWYLEQMAAPIGKGYQTEDQGHFRMGSSLTSYADSLSAQLGILYDFGPLELATYASQRVYSKLTQDGKDFGRSPEAKKTLSAYAVELARSFTSREGHSGRLGVQYILLPRLPGVAYLRIGVNMAVFERAGSPWLLRLNTHLFRQARVDARNIFSTLVELGQLIKETSDGRWRWGGFFGWTYRTFDDATATNSVRYEHMLFTVGPWAEYTGKSYAFKCSVPWRIWMDKETTTRTTYPTDLRLPELNVSLSWSL